MNRRHFLNRAALCGGILSLPQIATARTEHIVLIVSGGGLRKRDYYEKAFLAPNIHKLAREGFVFEQDHCEQVASHNAAFSELTQGLDSIAETVQVDAVESIPRILQKSRPRILICRETAHDIGHHSYAHYLSSVRGTDAAIGQVFDWITAHPYFSDKTAMVVRPEFGRDDEVNAHGQLHHSYGFYYTHRVASIFWGPDFNRGVDRETVIRSRDLPVTLARIFNVQVRHTEGRVVPGLFKV